MARRGPLPLSSPHWERFETAWMRLVQQIGFEPLRDHVDQLARDGRLRLKVRVNGEERVLTKADFAGVQPESRWYGIIRCASLTPDAVVHIWKPDLRNIFAADDAASSPAPEQPEKPVKTPRFLKRAQVNLTLKAAALIQQNPKVKPHGIVTKLQNELRDEGLFEPAKSTLQALVDLVFELKKQRGDYRKTRIR